MRVYLPLGLAELTALVADGVLPAPRSGHAVTAALISELPGADEEELEWVASSRAGDVSLAAALAAGARPRRHVLAAEVPESAVGAGADADDPTAVEVTEPVPLTRVDALLADTEDIDPVDAEQVDPGWFARQEIRFVTSASL